MVLIGGILVGIGGAALLPIAAWLGGFLIAIGYGRTAWILRYSRGRWDESLLFGYAVIAVLGLIIFVADLVSSTATTNVLDILGHRRMLLSSFTLAPPVLAILHYIFNLRPRKTTYTGG